MARPKVSAIPPTANGTTILIGLFGYAWAWATPANASAARAMPAAKVLRIMLVLLLVVIMPSGTRDPLHALHRRELHELPLVHQRPRGIGLVHRDDGPCALDLTRGGRKGREDRS